ncbi:hypothetical protein BDV95DRAFT_32758 [Massariosphaeria phaeospora]|uniref:Uncharacterized protein n=1 Tax=Massariosphaeria phaeospora TaxID=100035 RepID=A0A7C8MFG4_9PLEO|nr:hypothetical protein BDV95DRAFT_32758 [Massariosphaeria phaeospora]
MDCSSSHCFVRYMVPLAEAHFLYRSGTISVTGWPRRPNLPKPCYFESPGKCTFTRLLCARFVMITLQTITSESLTMKFKNIQAQQADYFFATPNRSQSVPYQLLTSLMQTYFTRCAERHPRPHTLFTNNLHIDGIRIIPHKVNNSFLAL